MISDLSDDEILEKYGIPLLVFLQKSRAHLSTTIIHWLKTNTVYDDTSDLREIYRRTLKILLERNLVKEGFGNFPVSGLTDAGYKLIQSKCIERDLSLLDMRKALNKETADTPAKVKGDKGETATLNVLLESTFPKYHRYVKNVLLKEPNGILLAEIDFLFVSTCGIIVIENKELPGTSKGTPNAPAWNYYPPKSKAEMQIKNPVLQNRNHIKVLNSRYQLKKTCYTSLIVFPDQATIHMKDKLKAGEYLIKRRDLIPTITNQLRKEDIWSIEEVNQIIEKVL